jgi:cell division inhibitor SepF
MAVGDLWHRTLVYFGMADEADDYDDDHYDDDHYDDDDREQEREREREQRDRERRSAASEDLERSYRERPNVRRLGPRRREPDFDDIFADEAPARGRPAPVRSVDSRPQPAEVHLVVPKSFNDAQQIADKFKGSIPVILNLQSAETDLAKRLIDFSSGLTYALDGGMQRVADKVFMLTPRNVEVSAEERARLLEKGFFNQY